MPLNRWWYEFKIRPCVIANDDLSNPNIRTRKIQKGSCVASGFSNSWHWRTTVYQILKTLIQTLILSLQFGEVNFMQA